MKVACVVTLDDARAIVADVIVFPEGVSAKDLCATSAIYPDAIIVGAVVDGWNCRGVLYKNGKNKIDYLKVSSDGRTRGSCNLNQRPIYQDCERLCIGVLVCMDVNNPKFSAHVIESVKSSNCPHRLICVPSDMGQEWFRGNTLVDVRYRGLNVILCNGITTHPEVRCQSFVTDVFGRKVKIQRDRETLLACLR